MTTPTPRELSADEIAAIRERLNARTRGAWFDHAPHGERDIEIICDTSPMGSDMEAEFESIGFVYEATDGSFIANAPADIAALLAHVAAVDARCRAYEAALADVDQLISYPEESGCARGDVGCLLDKVRKVAFDALLRAANGDGGRGNDGSGSGEAGT